MLQSKDDIDQVESLLPMLFKLLSMYVFSSIIEYIPALANVTSVAPPAVLKKFCSHFGVHWNSMKVEQIELIDLSPYPYDPIFLLRTSFSHRRS